MGKPMRPKALGKKTPLNVCMKFAHGWRIVRLGVRGGEFVLREIS
jgi:hypothetical protein